MHPSSTRLEPSTGQIATQDDYSPSEASQKQTPHLAAPPTKLAAAPGAPFLCPKTPCLRSLASTLFNLSNKRLSRTTPFPIFLSSVFLLYHLPVQGPDLHTFRPHERRQAFIGDSSFFLTCVGDQFPVVISIDTILLSAIDGRGIHCTSPPLQRAFSPGVHFFY